MNNASNAGDTIDRRLLIILLLPSYLSSSSALLFMLSLIAFPFLSLRVGSLTRQDLSTLHTIYHQSHFGSAADLIGQHLSQNMIINNVLLFLMWGSVGLVVYLIVQGILNTLKDADNMVNELGYVNADKRQMVTAAIGRAIIRLIALAAWWIVFRLVLFNLAPLAWDTAKIASATTNSINGWSQSIIYAITCALALHCLTVLMRLALLRPRLFSNIIV